MDKKFTVGVIRVLTSDDPEFVGMHGRFIEEHYPGIRCVSKCIPDQPEGRMAELVVGDIRSMVIRALLRTKGHDAAGKPFCNLLVIGNAAVDNQKALGGKKLREPSERAADIVQILKEIHVVFFYI